MKRFIVSKKPTKVADASTPVHPNVKSKLFPHQEKFLDQAMKWENDGHGGLLGAEMGTGKTLMMMSLFASDDCPKRTLIVAPLALLDNWRNEFEKHLSLPLRQAVVYHGKNRHMINLDDKLMVITSYETVRQDLIKYGQTSPLLSYRAYRIVLDEAHEIKNEESIRSKSLLEIPAKIRWVMTGTPIQNYRKDLESLAGFIGLQPYCNRAWWLLNANKEGMDAWKRDSYIFFSKHDTGLSLPPRHETNHTLEFSGEEREEYDSLKTEAQDAFEDYLDCGSQSKFGVILTKILRLKQFCDHPQLALTPEQLLNSPFANSTKTQCVSDIVTKIPANEKIIIFSQFIGALNMLKTALENAGHKCLLYTGKLDNGDRQKVIGLFNHDESCRVLLMSIKAGGVGLNLVRANHVLLLDPWWNRAIEEQALARVHRIGQTREVFVHRTTIKGSIEQWILSLQAMKQELAINILEDCDDSFVPSFSKDDLRQLFVESCY